MGKKPPKRKSEPRRKHVRTKPDLTAAVKPVRVAVVTTPVTDGGTASLRRDVQMVKSAVLYADKVELLGAAPAMIHAVCMDPASKTLGISKMIRYARALGTPVDLGPEVARSMPQISKMMEDLSKFPPELLEEMGGPISEMAATISEGQRVMDDMRESLLRDTGAGELVPAVDAGVLEVAGLRMNMESAIATVSGQRSDDEFVDPGLEVWIDQVKARLTDYRTRVLFDEESGSLVQSMLDEGVLKPHQIGLRLAGDAALGAGFVARLPTFGEGPMDELLDVRGELSAPLIRYRRSVANMTDKVTRSVGPDLQGQVEHLWTSEVHPALLELDETFHQHSWVRELARLAGKDIGTYLATGTGIFLCMGGTADIASIAASVAPKAGQMGIDGWKARNTGRETAKKHDLFYLSELNRRLG